MSVQRRPLTGMIVAGAAAPRALGTVDGVLHTLDTLPTQQGGPYIDTVSLYAENTTSGALVVSVTVAGGATISQSIPANAVVMLLDQAPFQAASGATGAASQIVGHGASAGLVFWGWFARPL